MHRGYYTAARRYEFYVRVEKRFLASERSERFCLENIKFISSFYFVRNLLSSFKSYEFLLRACILLIERFYVGFSEFTSLSLVIQSAVCLAMARNDVIDIFTREIWKIRHYVPGCSFV